jgi:hypothetical protein
MHDSCITVRIDLNVYIQIMNFLSCLIKSFILIELNPSYFL